MISAKIQNAKETAKGLANEYKEYGKGLLKSGANTIIGMQNAGARITGETPWEPYQPSNYAQAVGMNSGDKLQILAAGANKGGPANVVAAEVKPTTIVTPKVQSIVTEIKNSNIGVKVNPRNAATAQEGNVTLTSGNKTVNLRVETHQYNGQPNVRHANVEVFKTNSKGKKIKVSNDHILK